MSSGRVPRALAELVRSRADARCEYCRVSEWLSGQVCHIDHIVPVVHGGETVAGNLCLACAACNSAKLDKTEAIDPVTLEIVPLFNPRTQEWSEHFHWSEDGIYVVGNTVSGRATVEALHMNRSLALAARTVWRSVGVHPPD